MLALPAQSLPFNLSFVEALIYGAFIVFWAGTFVAKQVAESRRRAAKRQREAPKLKRASRDAFGEELNRTAPREDQADDASPSLLERRSASSETSRNPSRIAPPPTTTTAPTSMSTQARVSSSPPLSPGPVQPPEIGMLFRDPKGFAAQMQAYAEQQNATASGSRASANAAQKAPGTPTGNTPRRIARPSPMANRPVTPSPIAASQRPRATPVRTSRSSATTRQSPPQPEPTSGSGLRPLSIGSARRDANVAQPGTPRGVQLGKLNRDDLRQAILLSEIIQPPVSMRQSHLSGRSS